MDQWSSLQKILLDHYACAMAPASKKSTPRVSAPKKQRLSQAEATVRMMTATSQLLVQHVPGEVTVARICEKAGVHTDYVARYFGSREELMCQAIEAAFLGVFLKTESEDKSRLSVVLEGHVDVMQLAQARVRTIAYLLGCGVSPERFQPSQKLVLESIFSQSINPKVSDRTRMNLILVGTLLVQAMGTFAEVNDMTDLQKADMLGYIGYISQAGEAIQETLGWDKAKKTAPKKRK
ncbi:MAG: hypothetical protein RLZ67_678 [Actinomycetota bacterium]|jgi:AcrR family transcriptional regulator